MSIEQIISKRIESNNGSISFDVFMDIVLYDPKFGYYRQQRAIFGEQGDFITAPEISDLFGYCLARQCRDITVNGGDILEFGAGSGILATQILFELARLNALPKKYYILELSSKLKQQQKEIIAKVLPEIYTRVEWLDKLPKNFVGVMIANEVLDAIPVKRVVYKNDNFFELVVAKHLDKFVWKLSKNSFKQNIDLLPKNSIENFITEINPRAMAWIESIYESMEKGLVLLIDYGMSRKEYHHIDRINGTLRCYYRHKLCDNPFENIGKQDITASVNFSDIAQTAVKSGFELYGYCNQAMFLISMGIDKYLTDEKDSNNYIKLAEQTKKLTMPDSMGEIFKVLALTKKQPLKLQGFKEQNLIDKL